MEFKKERMEKLIFELNEASRHYYSGSENTISDILYDKKLAELAILEELTGIILPNSPTRKVGFPPEGVEKMPHHQPILSLKDTKSVDELLYFLGEHDGILSWKLDGISIILHYANGNLINALTRGDGETGKVIFKKALKLKNVPTKVPFKNELIIRGEGCISLNEFEQIKKSKDGERYSNPRNLAAGIINTIDATPDLLRRVTFIVHSIIEANGKVRNLKTRSEQFGYLKSVGFKVVDHSKVLNFQLIHEIDRYTKEVNDYPYPVDGLVLSFDDIAYGNSLGATSKFPKHSIAFKWPDISTTTKVQGMKWSVSRTGLITPVVIFDPVEIEGTTIKQANLHNLKVFENLSIGMNDILKVYKANKVIPEVEENLSRTGTEEPPSYCPICKKATKIIETERTRKLYCVNEECESRL